MVGATDVAANSAAKLSRGTMALLEYGKFVQRSGAHMKITKDGFSFVLQEANTQVWRLLLVYLDKVPEVSLDNLRSGMLETHNL